MEHPTTSRSLPVSEDGTTSTVGGCPDGLATDPQMARKECRARSVSLEFRYLDHKDAWVPLAVPVVGRYLDAAQLVRMAVSEARARGIRCMHTSLELAHPMTHEVLGALREHLGTGLKAVDTRRAGSSVMVTALLLDPPLAPAVIGHGVTACRPDVPYSRPTTAVAR